jgi:hypothetical protein
MLRFAAIALAASCAAHAAQAQPIPAGTYITEGGWGTLVAEKDGRLQLDTIGANGHSCGLEAWVRDMKALTPEGCRISFERSLDRVSVNPDPNTEAACRGPCGARAFFKGDYYREVPACRAEPVKRERDRFTVLYRSRKYREAAGVLSALLNRCGRFMYWLPDEAQLRNDLALTYHHLSDDAACLGVLSPLRRAFVEDEGLTGRAFTPVDEDEGQAMVRITRFNWKTCGGQNRRGKALQ